MVCPASTLEAVLPGASLEAIFPVGPEERIVAGGAGKHLARDSRPAKCAPTITTITMSKMYSRFIRLPALEATDSRRRTTPRVRCPAFLGFVLSSPSKVRTGR